MYIGVDYYPEHWPVTRWATDAKLMHDAGFNVVRLAEFAWSRLEPAEGQFDFKWLDDALAILAQQGISAVLGTPTAVMPAWVAHKYPETLATEKNGTRIAWGMRKNNCFTSGTYRLLSERITRAMAEHFAATPNVIGWQTDNEFGDPQCFCDTCRAEFHEWLRRRYGTTDALNTAWGTHFWGHQVSQWDEITLPASNDTFNPSQCLDWKRFQSWLNVRFQADQLRILRATCPKQFVTHNLMGFFKELNYYDLATDLDFVAWDNYPIWEEVGKRWFDSAAAGDLMRGLKNKPTWIMETNAGPGGWGKFGRNPYPGEMRAFAYQQIAHGAEGYVWFRWRTCTAGREQYWHGLLGHDGVPARRYQEAAQTAQELHRLAPILAGTTVQAEVAVLHDYESLWALDFQAGYEGNDTIGHIMRYCAALYRAGVGIDFVSPHCDISRYRVVIAPQLFILPDALADKLRDFVKAGGTLLTDLRSGVKNETNLCHDRTLPGKLSEVLGIRIEEYEARQRELPIVGSANLPGSATATLYSDWVIPGTAEVLAGYDAWHLQPYAAVTQNRFGKGHGFYVGTIAKEPAFYDRLIARVLGEAGIKPVLTPPPGVEMAIRRGAGKEVIFLLNSTDQPVTIAPPTGASDAQTGQPCKDSLTLDRFDVVVLLRKSAGHGSAGCP